MYSPGMGVTADKRIRKATDGTYGFRVDLGTDPVTGKRRQARRVGIKTQRAAADELRTLEVQALNGNVGLSDSGQTVADYLALWLDALRPSVEPNTADGYGDAIRNWIVPHIGDVRLRDVTPLMLQALYGKLGTQGRCVRPTKAKPRPSQVVHMVTGGQGKRYHIVDPAGVARDAARDPSLPADAPVSFCRRPGLPADMPPGSAVCGKCLASFGHTREDPRPRGLGPRSVKLAHTVMHKALKQAVSWQLITYNPAAQDLVLPKQPRHTATWWTPEEVSQFFSAVEPEEDASFEELQWSVIWKLMLATGLRRGEALAPGWADVDLDRDAGLLRVVRSNTVERAGPRLKDPKTQSSQRVVVLTPPVVRMLREHRKRQMEFRLLVGPMWTETGLIFTKADGTALRPDTFNGVLTRACRRAGVKRLTAKGLRHSFATLALDQGVHMKLVQEILGHSDMAITADIYTHSTTPLHQEASAAVSDFLFAGHQDASSTTIRAHKN